MRDGNRLRRTERLDTLVGHQTELWGDLRYAGGLHIDGSIKGNVIAVDDGTTSLMLSERGTIEGEVRVPHVVINGVVIGDIYATGSVELAPRARITGNVYYRRLEVAMGAEVNGSLMHLDEAGRSDAPGGGEAVVPGPAKT